MTDNTSPLDSPAARQAMLQYSLGVKVSVEIIYPEQASKYLATIGRQRKWRQADSVRLGRDIVAGNWLLSSDAVAFDWNGNCLNAQHRLYSVVITGEPICALVVRGLDPEVFKVTDVGRRRSAAQMFQMQGHKQASVLAAALRLTLQWETTPDKFSNSVPSYTNDELLDALHRHPDIEYSVEVAARLGLLMASHGLRAALHYRLAKIDLEDADVFFELLGSGANMSEQHPVLVLRNALLSRKTPGTHQKQEWAAAYVIKGWNAFRRRQEIKQIKYGSHEQFPVPE